MNKLTLVPGQLYQVKREKGWIIAEYVQEVAAHSYEYMNLSLSYVTGPKRVRNVPMSHVWRKVGFTYTAVFYTAADGMETRPVTEDTVAAITNLRAEIKRLDEETKARRRELITFCNH